jgi:hypothetical protein
VIRLSDKINVEDLAIISIDNIIEMLPGKCLNCEFCRNFEGCAFQSFHWKQRVNEAKKGGE